MDSSSIVMLSFFNQKKPHIVLVDRDTVILKTMLNFYVL